MDPAKAACDLVTTCWDRTANYRKYVRSLGDNLAGLESKTGELRGVYKDVKRLVVRAEQERWIRKDHPAQWLRAVKDLREEAGRVVADGRQMMLKSCLCGICFINCRARYHQSKLAEAKRAELETKLAQGRDFKAKEDVAYEPEVLTLERSLGALRDKRDDLRDMFETVKLRVEKEEEGHLVRTPEVGGWLKRAGDLLLEVLEILKQGRDELEKVSRHGAGDDSQSQRNSQSYSVIAKRADEKSGMLREKLEQYRGFTVLTYKPVDPLIVEMPLECHVGAESTFQEVWDWVRDEKVKRIGLFGMGGVGKTTLLKRLHNQFLQVSHDYDFAVWVVVSKQIDLDKIQKTILEKLKVKADDWKDLDTTGRAAFIHSYMKDKNFLLFLDDLWDPIDLIEHVGVPPRDGPKKQKIIFTTREQRVCDGMKADRMKRVECLQPKDALKLSVRTWGKKLGVLIN